MSIPIKYIKKFISFNTLVFLLLEISEIHCHRVEASSVRSRKNNNKRCRSQKNRLNFFKSIQSSHPADEGYISDKSAVESYLSHPDRNSSTFNRRQQKHGLDGIRNGRPLVIAHRGSSGVLPETTLEAFQLAIEQGADFIECDVHISRDLIPYCLHDAWLNETTNVREVFGKDRVNEYYFADYNATFRDYFSVDFTSDELKSLRKRQRYAFRDQGYNDIFSLATLEDFIQLAKNGSRSRRAKGRGVVGIYVEIKNSRFLNELDILKCNNMTIENLVLSLLHRHGYNDSRSPCIVEVFDPKSLFIMRNMTKLPLLQLVNFENRHLLTDQALDLLSRVAYGIGPDKRILVDVDPDTNRIKSISDLVDRSHRLNLKVHPYTFRNENSFLAWDYGQDARAEFELFTAALRVDGIFTDFPASYADYLDCHFSSN